MLIFPVKLCVLFLINLFDFQRDPSTLVMNKKSIKESKVLNQAIKEKYFTSFDITK